MTLCDIKSTTKPKRKTPSRKLTRSTSKAKVQAPLKRSSSPNLGCMDELFQKNSWHPRCWVVYWKNIKGYLQIFFSPLDEINIPQILDGIKQTLLSATPGDKFTASKACPVNKLIKAVGPTWSCRRVPGRHRNHDICTMYHDVPRRTMTWRTMTYHDLPWCTMTYHDVPWCTMTYHDVPWRTTTYHDMTYHDMTYHDVPWRAMTYHDVPWRTMTYHDHNHKHHQNNKQISHAGHACLLLSYACRAYLYASQHNVMNQEWSVASKSTWNDVVNYNDSLTQNTATLFGKKCWGRIVPPTIHCWPSFQARYRAMHKSPGAQRRSTSLPEWASLPARRRPNTAAPASDPLWDLRRSSHEVLGTSKSSLNLVYIYIYVDLCWFMLLLIRTRNWMLLRKLDLPRGAA